MTVWLEQYASAPEADSRVCKRESTLGVRAAESRANRRK